jgi:hypothetical protein
MPTIDMTDVIRKAVASATADPEEIVDDTDIQDPVETDEVAPGEEVAEEVEGAVEEPVEGEVVAEPKVVEEKPAVVEKPAEVSADDAFAKEHGYKAKDKNGKENRIPHSRVVKITSNAVTKAKATWDAEAAPVHEKVKIYEDRLVKIGETEAVMFGDAKRFLSMLTKSVPGYAELLPAEYGGRAAAPATSQAVSTDPADQEPPPDVKDAAGNLVGYSAEGLAKLRAWDRSKAVKEAVDALGSRIKPFEEKERAAATKSQLDSSVNNQLEDAAQWEGFQENAKEILAILDADRGTPTGRLLLDGTPELKFKETLASAYRKVVIPKLKADRTALEATIEKDVLARLRKAPRSSSAGAGSVSAGERVAETATPSNDPMGDAIRRAIRGKTGA